MLAILALIISLICAVNGLYNPGPKNGEKKAGRLIGNENTRVIYKPQEKKDLQDANPAEILKLRNLTIASINIRGISEMKMINIARLVDDNNVDILRLERRCDRNQARPDQT